MKPGFFLPVRVIAAILSNGPPFDCDDAADVNDDGVLDQADVDYLLARIYFMGPPPPAPFPACGVDPTADALGCGSFPPCQVAPNVNCSFSRLKTWSASLCPLGDEPFTVLIRDDGDQPLAGIAGTYLDFSDCSGQLTVCGDYPDWPLVYGDPSDSDGEVNFYISAYGACPTCSVDVYLAACGRIARVPIHTFDVDGDAVVTPADWNFGADECLDFDGSGSRGGGDLSTFTGHLWHVCPDNECNLLVTEVWTEPAGPHISGETIDVHYTVTNRNDSWSCTLTSLELLWNALGENPPHTAIEPAHDPGILLGPHEEYQYTVADWEVPVIGVIGEEVDLSFYGILQTDLCEPDTVLAQDVVVRICQPGLVVCREVSIPLPPGASVNYIVELPPDWTYDIDLVPGVPPDPDSLIYTVCTSDHSQSGDWQTIYIYDEGPPQTELAKIYMTHTYSSGDCNSDCNVNPVDVVWLVNYVYRSIGEPIPWRAGNVFCPEGKPQVNPVDVVYLVNYVYRQPGPPPPMDCPGR